MSRDSSFKIELKGLKGLQEKLKGAERGHGAYARMTEIAKEFVQETKKYPGTGTHYYVASGNAPTSEYWVPSSWKHKQEGAEYPSGYLHKHHEIGGRKGMSVTVVSSAPYTAKIINGGPTRNGGEIAPNNYPSRTLKYIQNSDERYEQLIRATLVEYYNLHDYL